MASLSEKASMEELTFKENVIKINTEQGAALVHWAFPSGDKSISLIKDNPHLSFNGSLLFPFPNRLSQGKYQFGGEGYQFSLTDGDRPNTLHGHVFDKHFQLIERTKDSLTFQYEYSGDQEEYPFPYRFKVSYILKDKAVDIELSIENTGKKDLPCGFGWHPYFDLKITQEASEFKLPEVTKIEVDEGMIPTGEEEEFSTFNHFSSLEEVRLDTCFRIQTIEKRNSTFLKIPQHGTLEVWQDQSFPFIQVFKPDEEIIAIEPMTCGIDAFNTLDGLKVLSPQQVWAFKMGLKFS